MKGSFVTCFFTSRLVELELQNVAHKISERKNNNFNCKIQLFYLSYIG